MERKGGDDAFGTESAMSGLSEHAKRLEAMYASKNQLFVASLVISSGKVQTKNKRSLLSKGIKLAGVLIPLPGAQQLLTALAAVFEGAQGSSTKAKADTVAAVVPSLTAFEGIAEEAAYLFKVCNDEQLLKLSRQGAHDLADCVVARIIHVIETGKMHLGGTPAAAALELLCALLVPFKKQGFCGQRERVS